MGISSVKITLPVIAYQYVDLVSEYAFVKTLASSSKEVLHNIYINHNFSPPYYLQHG